MNKKVFFVCWIFICVVAKGYSQINYSAQVEIGSLQYQFNTVQVDPGPNWNGYNLQEANGLELNVSNGIIYKEKLFVGLGFGYLNFEGVNGLSVFSDVDYFPLKTRVTPLIYLKMGYSHVWNQYPNGTGTGLGEFGVGFNFRITEKFDVYMKSGFLMTQQSLLVPVKLGLRF